MLFASPCKISISHYPFPSQINMQLFLYISLFSIALLVIRNPNVTKHQFCLPRSVERTTLFWIYFITCKSRYCPDCAQIQSWNNNESNLMHFLSLRSQAHAVCYSMSEHSFTTYFVQIYFYLYQEINFHISYFVITKSWNLCNSLVHQIYFIWYFI